MKPSQTRRLRSFDDAELYVEIYDSPQGDAVFDVVLVHGLTGDTAAYSWVIEGLQQNSPVPIRCLTFDLRGHGWSACHFPVNEPHLIRTLARDLNEVCQQLVTHPLILAGQSLFGLVIQHYFTIEKHIPPVATVLITPVTQTAPLSINSSWWWHQLLKASRAWTPHPTKRSSDDHLRYLGSFDYSPHRIRSDITFMGLKRYLLLWLSLFGQRSSNLAALNNPNTHYIYGLQDRIVSSYVQRRVLKHLPLATSYPINSNHNAIVNHPKEVTSVLLNVITSCLPNVQVASKNSR